MLLITDRLIIRDFVESDWYEVHQYSADPEVTRFMFFEVNTEDQTRV